MVFISQLATSLDDLKSRITAAGNSLDEDTLQGVWGKFNYLLDVVRTADGGYTEHLIKWFTAHPS